MKSKNVLLIIIGLIIMLGLSAWSISWGPKMTPLTEVQSPGMLDERAGSYALTQTPPSGPTEEAIETEEVTVEETEEAASILENISGTVVNGSGGEVPEGLEVTLHGGHFEEDLILTMVIDSDNSFAFDDIELIENYYFYTTVDYLGVTYQSPFHFVESEITQVDLSVAIYDTTTDASEVVIEWTTIFFEVLSPEFVQVHHMLYISNYGDKTVIPPVDNEPVIRYGVPAEATDLIFEEGFGIGQPYVITSDGFGDPSSVIPGRETNQIYYAYTLPYSSGLEWVEHLTLRTGVVELFLPDEKLDFESDMFEYNRDEIFEDEIYNVYVSGMIPAGSELRAEITNDNSFPSSGSAVTSAKNPTTTIILGAVGLAMIGAGVWWWMRPSTSAGDAYVDDGSPEAIMDAIIALDARYEAGRIDEVEYLEERAAMKDRLRDALEK